MEATIDKHSETEAKNGRHGRSSPLVVSLEDGKYTYVAHQSGRSEALRYGQPWQDTTGNNLVAAMASKIEQLAEVLKKHAVREDYDFPGDTPVLCGHVCMVCGGTGDTADSVDHKSSCVLSSVKHGVKHV